MTDLVRAVSPWATFLLVASVAPFAIAVAVAVVSSILLLDHSFERGRVNWFDIPGIVYFLAVGSILLVTQPSDLHTWAANARSDSGIVLALVVIGSAVANRRRSR